MNEEKSNIFRRTPKNSKVNTLKERRKFNLTTENITDKIISYVSRRSAIDWRFSL